LYKSTIGFVTIHTDSDEETTKLPNDSKSPHCIMAGNPELFCVLAYISQVAKVAGANLTGCSICRVVKSARASLKMTQRSGIERMVKNTGDAGRLSVPRFIALHLQNKVQNKVQNNG
jgi:hypothetical protein